MKYKKYIAVHNSKEFIIEEDNPGIGFYLYVNENGVCVRDYLQNTLTIAKECALRDFSVPLNKWKEI